jgi:hypothetical protein
MPNPGGFQVDLNDLNTLANTDIPYIEQICTDAETTLKVDAEKGSTIFETATSNMYIDVETTFVETRSDLEYLLDSLSSSLEDCAKALREIHRRYQEDEDQNLSKAKELGAGL